MSTRRADALLLAGLALLAALGVALLRYATPEGLGLVNDSAAYINGARSLLAGEGYARMAGDGALRPITHFPPLYSLLLALFSRFSPNVFEAAAAANQMLWAGNILLTGWLALRLTGYRAAALLAAALFTASEALLRVHTFALSEPLFLLLTLGALLGLASYFRSPGGSRRALVTAGVLAGLAYLTRYVGAALLAAVLLALLVERLAWKTRLANMGRFLLGALPPLLAWSLRNLFVAGSATNRQFGWHPVAPSEWLEGLHAFWAFLLPSRFDLYSRAPEQLWSALLGMLLALVIVWLVHRALGLVRNGGAPQSWLAALIGLHLLGYLALIVVSMTVLDASTIFEDRILAPVYVALLLLIVALLAWLARRARGLRALALLIAAGLLLTGADDARRAANLLAVDGQGFASTAWAQSPTLAGLRALPEGAVYTNRLSAVNILTQRPAYALLSDVDPVTLQPRAGYAETQAAIRAAVLDGRAYLVVFDSAVLLAGPEAGWFRALVDGLPVRAEYSDGAIYGQGDAR